MSVKKCCISSIKHGADQYILQGDMGDEFIRSSDARVVTQQVSKNKQNKGTREKIKTGKADYC